MSYPPPPPPPREVPPSFATPDWPGRSRGLPAQGEGSLATLAERSGARLIDALVWLVLMMPLVALESGVRAITGIEGTEDGDALSGLLGMVALAVVIAYDPVTTRLFSATPGKKAVGLRVVREDTLEPVGAFGLAGRALIHFFLWGFCLLPGLMDIFAARGDQLRRTWHDRALKSIVVRTRSHHAISALPPPPPVVHALPEPWASLVREADQARNRFDRATAAATSGPLRERLDGARREINACVIECQRLAARGAEVEAAAGHVDVERVRARAQQARADAAASPRDRDARALAEALESEAESAERLQGVVTSTHRRVQRLVARLNDAVNRGTQVVYDTGDTSRIDTLVEELSALQAGMAEVEHQLDVLR